MILGLQVIKNLDFAQQVDDAEETQADYSHKLLFDAPDAVYWMVHSHNPTKFLVVSANTDLFCQGKAFLPRSIFFGYSYVSALLQSKTSSRWPGSPMGVLRID